MPPYSHPQSGAHHSRRSTTKRSASDTYHLPPAGWQEGTLVDNAFRLTLTTDPLADPGEEGEDHCCDYSESTTSYPSNRDTELRSPVLVLEMETKRGVSVVLPPPVEAPQTRALLDPASSDFRTVCLSAVVCPNYPLRLRVSGDSSPRASVSPFNL